MTRPPAKSFEDLLVWQRSHALALRVYKETARFPREEIYGLTAQMRRAAVSVPANIAEAFKRRRSPDKARVLNIAQGSLEELRYFVLLARDLSYTASAVRWDETEEIARMLGAYVQSLLTSGDER
jgi:four helix bundle protein